MTEFEPGLSENETKSLVFKGHYIVALTNTWNFYS